MGNMHPSDMCAVETCRWETPIPSDMCVGETCIIDWKRTSLVVCVQETHILRDTCAGHIIPGETCITMTTEK